LLNAAKQKGNDARPIRAQFRPAVHAHQSSAEGFLALYDSNGVPGKSIEYDQDRAAQFAGSDRNHDGELDRENMRPNTGPASTRARPNWTSAKTARHTCGLACSTPTGPEDDLCRSIASGKRLFDTADRNRDGVIDAADADCRSPASARRSLPSVDGGTDFGQSPIHPMQRRCRSDSRHRRRHQPRPRHDTACCRDAFSSQRGAASARSQERATEQAPIT
jgi:hypothetical protein